MREIQTAVRDGLTASGSPLRDELATLWYELDQARWRAINGRWSMGCEGMVYRIARLTLLLGVAARWDEVPMPLVLNGWYEEINAAIGFPTPVSAKDRRTVKEYQRGRDA